jgi:hypothetical protein
MKRHKSSYIKAKMRTLLCLALWVALAGCDTRRDILEDEGAWVAVEVDWKLAGIQPFGVSIYVFEHATGKKVTQLLTNEMRDNVTLDSLKLHAGRYSLLVFNETEETFDDVSFRGTDGYLSAEAYAKQVQVLANNRYVRGAPAQSTAPLAVAMAVSDEPLAVAHLEGFEVDYSMARSKQHRRLTLTPKRLSVPIMLTVHVKGLSNLHAGGEHTGSLSSLAESVFLVSGATSSVPAAYWFTLTQTPSDPPSDDDDGTLEATFISFGPMDAAPGDNILMMTLQLADGTTHEVKRDVTGMLRDVEVQTGTGIGRGITVEVGLGLAPADSLIVLPNVDGDVDGLFKVDVDGWGNATDMEIPTGP